MLATALLTTVLATADLATFHIGNSLTWDSVPSHLPNIAGYHIRCGSSLPGIADNPTDTCIAPNFGFYQDALANHDWDVVFVQPFDDSTLPQDAAFIRDIHAREPSAQLVIYESWPDRDNFVDDWFQPLGAESQRSRAYFDALSQELSDVPHDRLRVGETLLDLSQSHDIASWYRDGIHLGDATGRYVPHASVYHYLHGGWPSYWDSFSDSELASIHASIQAVAIPEPSSFLMVLLCSLCCATRLASRRLWSR
jgi:hypothetical protein